MGSVARSSISPERETEYSGDVLRNVSIAFTVLETVAVALRFTSLKISQKRFGMDDFLTIPGYICCIGLNALCFVGINYGRIGYHLDVVEATYPQAIPPWAKCLYATPIIYSAGCCFPRIVLLTLYLRIFEKHKPYRIACYSLMGLIVAFAVSDMFAGAFECWPAAYLWDKSIAGGHCDNIPQFYRWGTLPNVFIDLMMLILPQPVVWSLQVPGQVKLGLAVTFLTGSIGMVTSICRCVAFFTNNPLLDGTWISVTFLNWSVIETGVYLIAACLPCYRPLIRYAVNRGRTTIGSGYRISGSTLGSSKGVRSPVNASHPPLTRNEADLEMSTYVYSKSDLNRESDEQSLVVKAF